MYSKFVIAVAFMATCATVVSAATQFKRLRQEIEVTDDGQIHVFIRVLDYNSSFELLLRKRKTNLFSQDHILWDGKEEQIVPEFLFVGTVRGYPNSIVSGSIHDGAFEGSVRLDDDRRYYIENGKTLLGPDFCSQDFRFCYVIYDSNDVYSDRHHHHSKRSAGNDDDHGMGMCGWHSKRIRDILMKQLNQDTYPVNPVPIVETSIFPKRSKRAVAQNSSEKICNLFMQADPKLWELFLSDYNNDATKAKTKLLKYFAELIQGVNDIYATIDFQSADGSFGPFKNMQFRIVRTAIYSKEKTCNSNNADPALRELCRDNIDSAEFLNINSRLNHDDFCLAYLVTHRQFSEGVQGLAWVGYPKTYAGGVCQRNVRINGKPSSYNTGIATSNNNGKRSPTSSMILTMSHEMGHNFGSPHDEGDSCQPGGSQGNYIMYPYVTPGNRPNNKKFSQCSHNKIAENLNSVVNQLTSQKSNCFVGAAEPHCGNGIVEEGETCDCGYGDECTDKCCIPAGQEFGCTLRPGALCSPTLGVCCDTDTCSFYRADIARQTECRPASECAQPTYCTPSSASCPKADAKSDGTLCWENSRVCSKGDCNQPLCSLIRSPNGKPYESCQEIIPEDSTDFGRYCYLSCQAPDSQQCVNSVDVTSATVDPAFYTFLMRYKNGTNQGAPIRLGSGTPCDNFKGFCDVFYKCRKVNSQGPLASLFALLSGEEEPQTAAQWLVAYWWVVAIIAVVFVALCLVLTQILARQCLPSSNPKKHRRRPMGDACRRTLCPCRKGAAVGSSQR